MPPVHSKKPCSDCMFADGGKCEKHLAAGGEVEHHSPAGGSANRSKAANRMRREDGQEGVHKSHSVYTPGTSTSGYDTRGKVNPDHVKGEHAHQLRRLKETGGPTSGRSGFADGGDVDGNTLEDPMKPAGEDDMGDMIASELMEAFEKKDKQGVKDAIEALVMECMNKGDHDV